MSARLGALLVAALLVVTGAVVALALRSPTPPPLTFSIEPDAGALAAAGDRVWRWVGPSACTDEADQVPVQRLTDAGWEDAPIPLVSVTRLSFGSVDDGIALGTTSTCAVGAAVTHDGGQTWGSEPDVLSLKDAWWVGNRVWGVTRVDGPARAVWLPASGDSLGAAGDTSAACDAGDGPPTLVAFATPRRGLLLCQQISGDGRLLARTANSGRDWERWTDARQVTGLDGPGPIVDLDVVRGPSDVIWTLFDGGECPEGQLRRSVGRSFDRLRCPSETVAVDRVLAVAFTTPRRGFLLGLVGGEPLLAQTRDGGSTWAATPDTR
jgi:hypothetical protein